MATDEDEKPNETAQGEEERGSEQPPAGDDPHTRATPTAAYRPPAEPLSDAERLDEARRRSLDQRRATPTGALSLVNARAPSNLPPPPWAEEPTKPPPPLEARPMESLSHMNAVDRGWAELEATTRRTPVVAEDGETPVPPEPSPAGPTEQEMRDRVSLGDYTGALVVAERLLGLDPNNEAAAACADTCRATLKQMYLTKLGPLDRVPLVTVPREQLRWLSIDHRAGFVLSLIDGVSSLEMILDVSGMPELDALRILCDLHQQRILAFR